MFVLNKKIVFHFNFNLITTEVIGCDDSARGYELDKTYDAIHGQNILYSTIDVMMMMTKVTPCQCIIYLSEPNLFWLLFWQSFRYI